ncbi:hypothetical protein VTI28DRAFT_5751 [Corynascus sepedonium]
MLKGCPVLRADRSPVARRWGGGRGGKEGGEVGRFEELGSESQWVCCRCGRCFGAPSTAVCWFLGCLEPGFGLPLWNWYHVRKSPLQYTPDARWPTCAMRRALGPSNINCTYEVQPVPGHCSVLQKLVHYCESCSTSAATDFPLVWPVLYVVRTSIVLAHTSLALRPFNFPIHALDSEPPLPYAVHGIRRSHPTSGIYSA